VLPTLNPDGSRRWLDPKLFPGRFFRRRRALAWTLIAIFSAIPYLRMRGRPLILLDVVHREFTLFGTTFLPTDSVLLMLLLVGIFLAVFLLTAIFGRVWCGWACPQTVYMEFLFRPIERLIEGRSSAARQLIAGHRLHPRRLLKYAVFLALALFLAHTFLAYFVGVTALARWVRRSPLEHPMAFLVMGATTALMLLDFGWFREQVCMVACPYGRFQSVLLDRRSLIVGYDRRRGEPRSKLRREPAKGLGTLRAGDCVDCSACVACCPTGIDIRDGLQMECIHCTQCMDACDSIMDRLGRPRGLIRLGSRDEFDGRPRRILRPRIAIYPLLLLLVWGALGWTLAHRPPADVTVLRALGSPFTLLPGGRVSNQIRVKIVNRTAADQHYRIELMQPATAVDIIAPDTPLAVPAGHSATTSAFLIAPLDAFERGERPVRLRIADESGWTQEVTFRLLGPVGDSSYGHEAEHTS
jgi:cytochrome c oxidase accessory protein FixG